MNQVIIDNSLLLSSGIIAALIVRSTRQRQVGGFASFLLLFSALVVFLNMWGHTVAVLAVNYKRYLSGGFQYSFAFYALLLLGIIFILVSGFNIHYCRKIIKGDTTHHQTILWLNGATALGFLPLMPINPIALLPVIASVVSTICLLTIRRSGYGYSVNPNAVPFISKAN